MPLNVFGGGVTDPSEVSYRAVSLTANVTLLWPSFAQGSGNVVARGMDVTPSGPGLEITFPDARQVGVGMSSLVRNVGSDTFTIRDANAGVITTIATGVAKFVYLTDNSTLAGTWTVVTFGTGTSSADASLLAGLGIKAIGSTLAQKYEVSETTSGFTIAAADRAKMWTWTSGSHSITLPTSASLGADFFFIAKNGGSGTITFNRSGSDTIDGATSFQLAPDESSIIHSSGGNNRWFSVGKGRSVAFAFTQLVKNVGGGIDVTLSSAEAANKVMSFTGVLTANINVIVPNTVSVYYVFNNTSGAFTLTVKTVAGSGITVSQGTRDILVCDATNVQRAVDNTVSSIIFDAGSESSPSVTFVGDTDTGLYRSALGDVSVTNNGTRSATFAPGGFSAVTAVFTPQVGSNAASNLSFTTSGGTQAQVIHTASAVNYVTFTGGVVSTGPTVAAAGSDPNISIAYDTKGTGSHFFRTNSAVPVNQVVITHTPTATRWITLTGSNGGNPTISTSAGLLAAGAAIAAVAGTAADPAYTFSAQPTWGIYQHGDGVGVSVSGAGSVVFGGTSTAVVAHSTGGYNWYASGISGTIDLRLWRDGANALAQRNGTNSQTLRIYNTFTDASNHERLSFRHDGTRFLIEADRAGTGLSRALALVAGATSDLQLSAGGATRFNVTSAGHFTANTDNVSDIGASGASRPRTIFVGTSMIVPLIIGATLTNPGITSQTLTWSAGGTTSWNMDLGGIATVTASAGNTTMGAPTNLKVGYYMLKFIQDSTPRTITWNAVFKWDAGAPPVLSTAAGATDAISFFCDGTNMIGGTFVRGAA